MYIRNLAQLLLSPTRAWQDIAAQNIAPSLLMRNGFYRLMSVVAITAFVRNLYATGAEFDVATALQTAMVQFISLFLSLAIARSVIDMFMSRYTADPEIRRRVDTLAIYGISLMAVIQTIVNISPVEHMLFAMLPAFVVVVLWQTRQYMHIKDDRTAAFMVLTIATIVVTPLLLNYALSLII